MHIKLLSVAMAAAILTGCGTLAGGGASSDEAMKATKSYVASSVGSVVGLSGDGCLRTSKYDDDTMIGSCEGKEAMAEKEMEAPKEEVAVAPPPPPPPPPKPEMPAPAAEEEAEVEKVVLSGRALFPYDSAQLTGQGNREMTTLIEKLKSYSDIELVDVVGHADSRGATEYNQGLSERRAETVKATLQGSFPQVPMTASGLGETAPIASNDTAEGRRLNRRVEIRVEAIN